jgi:uncharacterized protein (TIGR03067 family)
MKILCFLILLLPAIAFPFNAQGSDIAGLKNSAVYYLDQGDEQNDVGNLQKAHQFYLESLKHLKGKKDKIRAFASLTVTYFELKKYNNSKIYCEKLLNLAPKSGWAKEYLIKIENSLSVPLDLPQKGKKRVPKKFEIVASADHQIKQNVSISIVDQKLLISNQKEDILNYDLDDSFMRYIYIIVNPYFKLKGYDGLVDAGVSKGLKNIPENGLSIKDFPLFSFFSPKKESIGLLLGSAGGSGGSSQTAYFINIKSGRYLKIHLIDMNMVDWLVENGHPVGFKKYNTTFHLGSHNFPWGYKKRISKIGKFDEKGNIYYDKKAFGLICGKMFEAIEFTTAEHRMLQKNLFHNNKGNDKLAEKLVDFMYFGLESGNKEKVIEFLETLHPIYLKESSIQKDFDSSRTKIASKRNAKHFSQSNAQKLDPEESIGEFALKVFQVLKNKDTKGFLELGTMTIDNFRDLMYADGLLDKNSKLLMLPHVKKGDTVYLNRKIPATKKRIDEFEETLSKEVNEFNREQKQSLFQQVNDIYSQTLKYSINLSEAKYSHCFYSFPKDLHVVFKFKEKTFSFRVECILFSTGWVITDDIDGFKRHDHKNPIREREKHADIVSIKTVESLTAKKSKIKEYDNFYTISLPLGASLEEQKIAIKNLGISAFWNKLSYIVKSNLTAAGPLIGMAGFVAGLPSVGNAGSSDIKVCANGQLVKKINENQTFLPIIFLDTGDSFSALPSDISIQKKGEIWSKWKTVDRIILYRGTGTKESFYGYIIPKNFEKTYPSGKYRLLLDTGVSQKFEIVKSEKMKLQKTAANKRLEGTWTVTSIEQNGEKLPEDSRIQFIFKGKNLIFREINDDEAIEFTFRTDEKQRPKHIDLTEVKNNISALGIFQQDKDSLMVNLRINDISLGRPKSFRTTRKSNLTLFVLKKINQKSISIHDAVESENDEQVHSHHSAHKQVGAGFWHTIGLKEDGTVVAVGAKRYGQTNISSWRNIKQVAAGAHHTIGLKEDGTVVAVGSKRDGQTEVSSWRNIKQVAAGAHHTIGLKENGTVVAVGPNKYGQTEVSSWRNIKQVAAGEIHTIGLKENGTVVAVGSNGYGQINVSSWKDVKQVTAGRTHTIGLKEDGTVVAVGSKRDGKTEVSSWRNIKQVAAGKDHTIGLKEDGTVVAVGSKRDGQTEVSSWRNIKQVAAGSDHTIGLKQDGTVVAVGSNDARQINVSSWNDTKEVIEQKAKKVYKTPSKRLSLFHKEVKEYVNSGAIFRSIWSNVEKVVWIKDICPGGFLVAVDYHSGGGRFFYEIRSFEFTLPNEVVSLIESKGNTYWNAETIRRNGIKSLGLIMATGYTKVRPWNKFKTGGIFENEKWKFPYKKNSGYSFVAEDIATKIYSPSSNLQKKYLGDQEIEFLKNPQFLFETNHRAATLKKIRAIEGLEIKKNVQKKKLTPEEKRDIKKKKRAEEERKRKIYLSSHEYKVKKENVIKAVERIRTSLLGDLKIRIIEKEQSKDKLKKARKDRNRNLWMDNVVFTDKDIISINTVCSPIVHALYACKIKLEIKLEIKEVNKYDYGFARDYMLEITGKGKTRQQVTNYWQLKKDGIMINATGLRDPVN